MYITEREINKFLKEIFLLDLLLWHDGSYKVML